jgi:hypothetical protein
VIAALRKPLLFELGCIGGNGIEIKMVERFSFDGPRDIETQSTAFQEAFEYFLEVVFCRMVGEQHGE